MTCRRHLQRSLQPHSIKNYQIYRNQVEHEFWRLPARQNLNDIFRPSLDLDMLKSCIPEIASSIELPDLKEVLKFFARGFSNQSSLDETRVAEIMKLALLKPSLHAHLKE